MKGSVDRISGLPDDVLIHILSYVTTREAVQTCILSKRWRKIWASVPVLNFGHQYLHLNGTTLSWKLERFVNGVLANREISRLDTVTYHCHLINRTLEPSMEWLDRVALLKPQEISVKISGFDEFKCPDSVFSCASLESLEFSLNSKILNITGPPKSISLPSLKTLKLRCVRLDDNFTQKLFLGCPVLESLILSYCAFYFSDISSNVLKSLELYKCKQFGHVRVSCPSLVSLLIHSIHCIRSISLENTTSLVNAEITLLEIDGCLNADILLNAKLLNGLSNVTTLDLQFAHCPELQEKWKEDICECRTFHNLKRLKIEGWDMISDFDLIACFLQHSPVLQQLTVHTRYCYTRGLYKEEPRQDVGFQLEYLETVTINSHRNDILARELVTMLGRYVKTIGNIIIIK